MAKAGKKSSTEITPGQARDLLVKVYGSTRIADELLREAIAAGRVSWRAQLVAGPRPGPEFWRSARIDYSEGSAREAYRIVVFDGRDLPATTECYGIWLSRAHVLALLPGVPRETKRDGRQMRRVLPALKKLYPPDGKAPDDVSTEAARARVNQELAVDSKNRGLAAASWDTVNRALGRDNRG
jgi:hypothetical protein